MTLADAVRTIDLQELRRYKDGGWELIPLHEWDYKRGDKQLGKAPRDAGWIVAKYTSDQLRDHIRKGGNIGVRMRDTDLVVDYDPRAEPAGRDVRLELELEYGFNLSDFPHVETGSGGAHYYMRLPEPARVLNGLQSFPGLEFKGLNRQVVAAGSIHPNGKMYRWASGVPIAAPGTVPEALLAAIRKPVRTEVAHEAGEITSAQLTFCLGQLDPKEFRSHDVWLELLMASHSATGGGSAGCEAFVAWSTSDPQFANAAEIIRERWVSFDSNAPGGITLGTLYMHVLDAGGRLPRPSPQEEFEPVVTDEGVLKIPPLERTDSGKPKATLGNCAAALGALGFAFRYDMIRDRIDVGGKLKWLQASYPSATAVFSDITIAMIQGLCMQHFGLELPPDKIHQTVTSLAHREAFNPIEDYLRALTWDGVARLDSWLVQYAGAADNAYSRAVGRITLLAGVARALVPGIKFDTMPVLEGPQGGFKSTLVRILGGEFAQAGLPNKDPNDKDVIAALRGKWIVEVEELSAMKRADVEAFKAFLSRQCDRARLAYERTTRDYPRQCVFIGTTNSSDYLRDSTGNRRFLPVSTPKILPNALAEVRDQLWAEALVAWDARPVAEALELPKDLWSFAGSEQEQRRAADPLEETVAAYLDKSGEDFLPTRTLLWECMRLASHEANSEHSRRISAIMHRLGWEKRERMIHGDRAKGYQRPQSRDWKGGA